MADHCMIDIETLDTGPRAVVLEIGAVVFEWGTGNIRKERVWRIDVLSCIFAGGTTDPDTIEWWRKQDRHWGGQSVNIEVALSELLGLFVYDPCSCFWANSPSFDLVILEHYYRHHRITKPWTHRQQMDFRTLKMLHSLKGFELAPYATDKEHHALVDCKMQIQHLGQIALDLELV